MFGIYQASYLFVQSTIRRNKMKTYRSRFFTICSLMIILASVMSVTLLGIPTKTLASQTKPNDFDTYLRGKNSPLAGQGYLLDLYGEKYNVDPRLVIAIAGDETRLGLDNGGLNCPQYKNLWNILDNGNCAKYTDWDTKVDSAGNIVYGPIEQISAQLGKYRDNDKLYTIEAIGKVYCDIKKDPKCVYWVPNVNQYYEELKELDANITTSNLTYPFDLGTNGIDIYQYCRAEWGNSDSAKPLELLSSDGTPDGTQAWMCRVVGTDPKNKFIEDRVVDLDDACLWQFGNLFKRNRPSRTEPYEFPGVYARPDNIKDPNSWKCYYQTDGKYTSTHIQNGAGFPSMKPSLFSEDCVTIDGQITENGTVLKHSACSGGMNQKWRKEAAPLWGFVQRNAYRIISVASGKCLDLQDWSTKDTAHIIQWECHKGVSQIGGSNQLWSLEKNNSIKNTYSGKCLEARDGGDISQAKCTGDIKQQWTFPSPTISQNTSIDFSKTIHISLGQTVHFPVKIGASQASAADVTIPSRGKMARYVEVSANQPRAVFMTSWPGSDIVMTLTSPSGRVIDRNTTESDVLHGLSPTSEMYTILNPEAGTWEVKLYGADVAEGGEDVLFELTTDNEVPLPELAYVEDGTLKLNIGSADRREARHIETEEINEDFTVKQLSADSFSVSAFGLTQVYTGATKIQADGDDGDDTITLESVTVPADLKGGSGDDVLQSGDGADTLSGGDGNDKINAGDGNDTVNGDDGNDELNGQGGQDTINGGGDNDTISGGGDSDTLHGNGGDDKINGDDGADHIHGDDGADSLSGGADDDTMNGGDGDDTMEGNDGADTMHGDGGNDQMLGQAGDDKMFGDRGDDSMDGGAGADSMEGNDGADTMHGGSENDKMYGNDGPDTMFGDDGQDTMYGNIGNDVMHGGGADDYMEGNQDADTMFGDDGQDDLIGGSPVAGTSDGGDTISGGLGQDVILGDNGTITRPGGTNAYNGSVRRDVVLFDLQTGANDTLAGDDGDDLAFGQGGNDNISGGAGNDYLEGNAGSDIVNGDAGQDDMIGGSSANDGVIDADRIGDGLLDMGDELHGGDNGDVMAGDNARITRPVDGNDQWLIDPNTGEPVRQVVLFDVEMLGGQAVNPLTSGSDRMFGDAGKDKMFGQGNGQVIDPTGMDPKDSVDNDRNGRESGASDSFDCLDGRDNDGDGLIDAVDPQCAVAIDDHPGGDEMHGGPDDDYMEGNHGSDWMFGDDGEDDLIGGSSAGDGVIGGPVMPTSLKDGNDVINGNADDDVLVGDNAQILRPNDAQGLNKRLVGGLFNLAIRDVRMATTPEAAGAFGNDWMSGGAGVDDMYGQLGNDYMEGNDGEDAMVGDLGKITNNLIGINDGIPDPDAQQLIAPNAPFFDPGELIYQNGSLYRLVELYSFLSNGGGAGNDTIYGGADSDAIHGGAGDDIMNGNGGDDRLFGGDDSDAMWGGPGHDIMFGGYGIDYLDVLPRLARADKKDSFLADPSTWFEAAKVDNYQGLDIMYGGWDRDWMQADVSAPGRVNGDRMIDWAGAFNAFYRCDAAYGDWVITRQHSPSVVTFLQELAQGFGAFDTSTPGTSGFRETAIVFPQEIKFNSNPPNPDNPAHFTCGPAK
jgi:Ca2+-binding RTX toxin-like protein